MDRHNITDCNMVGGAMCYLFEALESAINYEHHAPEGFDVQPRMAPPSIASLCPPARRGAVRRPRLAPGTGCTVGELEGKGAKRRERAPSGGALSFGYFSLREQRKVTLGRGRSTPD